jgi:hypothetical protein
MEADKHSAGGAGAADSNGNVSPTADGSSTVGTTGTTNDSSNAAAAVDAGSLSSDGDDDDANVWPAEFWNVCPPTNNHSEGRALSRADVPLLARALRIVKDAEAHVRPDCYTTVYEQCYCEGGPFESKTRPSLRIFQRVMGRAVQYWSSPTVEWESTSKYAALVEIGSELEMPSPDDAADNADTDAIDNTTALPAWSDKVTYDKLWQYNVADLTAGGYFPIDNLTLPLGDGVPKPITLACMGLGIPSFPKAGDIESNDDIAAAIKRSKGSSVNKSDILPTTTKAKKHLQKEVMRRSIISKTDPLPSPKNWKIDKCIEYLESHPTINIEHESILDFWDQLKKKVRDHFLDNSGGATATMWRIVRFIECALSGSLRPAFLKRNHQKTSYILDAKNSPVLPSSYYQQVADMFNSNIVLQSKSLSDSYGSPFEESVELNPPTQEHRITGEEVQNKMVKMRATYMTIEENIRASGQGEGSRFGNTVKSYVLNVRIEKGKPMANGDATGYGFTRFKEEDVFDELISVAPSSVAASMSSVPLILTDGKRGKTPLSDRPPKKGKTSDGSTVAVVDFLERMERNMSLTETRDSISQLQHRITSEETSCLNHKSQLSGFFKEYVDQKKQWASIPEDEIDKDCDEYEYYTLCEYNYKNCKNTIQTISDRIKMLHQELGLCQKEYEAAKEAAKRDEPDSAVATCASNKADEEDDEVLSVASNDGSAALSDGDIPAEEQIN